MKKINIIKSSREYTEIIKQCPYVKNKDFIIYYRENKDKNRYGISVPTKIGKANIRNKLKRRTKNIIDNQDLTIQRTYDYVIIIRKSLLEATYQDMNLSLTSLLKKIGAQNEKK